MKGTGAGLVVGVVYVIGAIVTAVAVAFILDARTDAVLDVAAAWTLATFWGVATTVWTLRDVLLERVAAGSDDVLVRIANANVRREVFRLFELLALMVIGLTVIANEVIVLTNRLLVLVVVLLLVANAVLDRLERRSTDQVIRTAIRSARKTDG